MISQQTIWHLFPCWERFVPRKSHISIIRLIFFLDVLPHIDSERRKTLTLVACACRIRKSDMILGAFCPSEAAYIQQILTEGVLWMQNYWWQNTTTTNECWKVEFWNVFVKLWKIQIRKLWKSLYSNTQRFLELIGKILGNCCYQRKWLLAYN